MNMFEFLHDYAYNKMAQKVFEEEGVEGAAPIWVGYSWIPLVLLDDEPALKFHIADTRRKEGQQAIDDITKSRESGTDLPYPKGFVHVLVKPEEVDNSEDTFPSDNAVLLVFFGWVAKDE